jgi:hypothetical protein
MKLQVLVIGSDKRDPSTEQKREGFKLFCQSLGAALAKKGHQIVVLSDDETYADPFVLRGYVEKAKDRKLPPVKIPNDTRFEELTGHSLIKSKGFEVTNDHPFNRIGTVRDVDAIVVVGGGREANAMVKIAEKLGKPIIPIKEFGGVAAERWKILKADYRRRLEENDELLKAIDRHYTDTPDKRGDDVVTIMETIVRSEKSKRTTIVPFLLCTELLAFVGGFALIITGKTYVQIAIPALILAMAAFGIVLRFLVKLLLDPDQQLPIKGFVIELGLGVGLSVIYYFLFRIGGSSIAPDLDQTMKTGPFESVAIVISILTIGVSFLLEDSLERARNKLSGAITL